MRTIRGRIIMGILICSVLTAGIIGGLSIWNVTRMAGFERATAADRNEPGRRTEFGYFEN